MSNPISDVSLWSSWGGVPPTWNGAFFEFLSSSDRIEYVGPPITAPFQILLESYYPDDVLYGGDCPVTVTYLDGWDGNYDGLYTAVYNPDTFKYDITWLTSRTVFRWVLEIGAGTTFTIVMNGSLFAADDYSADMTIKPYGLPVLNPFWANKIGCTESI